MVIAGLGHVIEKSIVDLNKVRAAQNKIVIARFLGDELMWTKAVEEYRQATGAQP
ncbi:host cell division inhibitory peptide Kil [Citrobacter sp. RHBSTW-00881]|nr:host cell division inhibitory peptide Kil [Citrobacter sp. RHBSTW-00881]